MCTFVEKGYMNDMVETFGGRVIYNSFAVTDRICAQMCDTLING